MTVQQRRRRPLRRLTAMCLGTLAAVFALTVQDPTPARAVGLLTPSDGSVPKLDLRDHKVSVVVEDGYAITTVEQHFANPSGRDLEATYSFPVPRKAAVSEFTYWIDGKPVTGEVVEKQKAQEIYQKEKAQGRETGLASQDGHKTFDINVWPVRAGQDARIRLAYIQPAHMDTGVGRYLYPLEEGGVDEQKLAFWTANQTVTGAFSFDLVLKPAYPVEALRLPHHPGAVVTREAAGIWRVHLDNKTVQPGPADPANAGSQTADDDGAARKAATYAPVRLDTDLVVYWRQKAGLPGAVDLVTYKGDEAGKGTFMLTLTPGMDLKPITEGRDWIFVLDKSGSMRVKIATLAEGVVRALGKLRANDRFRIVTFNDNAQEITTGFVPVTAETVQRHARIVRAIAADGSTNLYAGLDLGLSFVDADRTSAIVLVTDGVANTGVTETRRFLELVRAKDTRLFTAIMGNSANRPLLAPMTRASGGTSVSVSNSDDIMGVLLQATAKVTHEALHGLKVDVVSAGSGLRVADIARDDIRTLYRGEQLVLFGHYWGQGPARVTLQGKISGKPVKYETRFDFPRAADLNPELERLWAFAAIERQMLKLETFGPSADVKQAVVDLSVAHGIVTPYTSMVVLRDDRFASYGVKRANRDRLKVETSARGKRAQAPVRQTRVDTSKPMFQASRPRHSGGGSGGGSGGSGDFGLIGLMLAAGAAGLARSTRKRKVR
ncbi:MAG: VIT and vWA domain-containing protein [Methyloligellaceae bacterium]